MAKEIDLGRIPTELQRQPQIMKIPFVPQLQSLLKSLPDANQAVQLAQTHVLPTKAWEVTRTCMPDALDGYGGYFEGILPEHEAVHTLANMGIENMTNLRSSLHIQHELWKLPKYWQALQGDFSDPKILARLHAMFGASLGRLRALASNSDRSTLEANQGFHSMVRDVAAQLPYKLVAQGETYQEVTALPGISKDRSLSDHIFSGYGLNQQQIEGAKWMHGMARMRHPIVRVAIDLQHPGMIST